MSPNRRRFACATAVTLVLGCVAGLAAPPGSAGVAATLTPPRGSAGTGATGTPEPEVVHQVRPAVRQVRANTPAPGQLLHVTRMPGRQHLWCRGEPSHPGAPTIMIISGAGDFSLSWRTVQGRLSSHHRVCTYDRAGLGWSSETPTPRTGRHIVPELARLLRAGGVRGPLVLVGHSMGGIYARMFAARHPARIRGVVLVDPGDEHLDVDVSEPARQALGAGIQAAAARQLASGHVCATGAYARDLHMLPLDTVFPLRDARIERRLLAGWCRIWRTNAAEGRGAAHTWSQARGLDRGRHSLGHHPLGILVSDADLTFVEDPMLNTQIVSTWRRLQRQQVRLSSVHRFAVARGSSHAVMLDRPAQVAAMIRWAVSKGCTA